MRMAEIVYVRDANGNLVQTTIKDLREDRLEQLEEENKNLKEKVKYIRKLNTYDYNELQDLVITLEEENKKLNIIIENTKIEQKSDREHIEELEEENRKLKKECEENTMEIKKLKEELKWYKKQYQHSMGEYNGKLTKGGYASFNEYGELMEEDTLQELRDIGEI